MLIATAIMREKIDITSMAEDDGLLSLVNLPAIPDRNYSD